MQNNRASMFMPFEALKGFSETLKLIEREVELKKEISEDMFNDLNEKINNIKIGDKIIVKYYYDLEYIETKGIIKKIDNINKNIYLLDSKIKIEDIISIEKIY